MNSFSEKYANICEEGRNNLTKKTNKQKKKKRKEKKKDTVTKNQAWRMMFYTPFIECILYREKKTWFTLTKRKHFTIIALKWRQQIWFWRCYGFIHGFSCINARFCPKAGWGWEMKTHEWDPFTLCAAFVPLTLQNKLKTHPFHLFFLSSKQTTFPIDQWWSIPFKIGCENDMKIFASVFRFFQHRISNKNYGWFI